jgi:hypothetical protein
MSQSIASPVRRLTSTQNFPGGGGSAPQSGIGFGREILKLLMRQFLTKKLVCGLITGA